MASWPLLEERAHAPQHQRERDRDERQHGQHCQREGPVDGKEQDARADDQEHRRDERRHRLRDEHLDGIDVRGQVRQERRRRDLLDVRVILRRHLRDEARPQIARDPLGRIGLHHSLQVGEDEDADGRQQQLGRNDGDHERVPAVTVDRICHEPRNQQVEGVAGHGQHHEQADDSSIRNEQRPEAGMLWRRDCDWGCGFRHEAGIAGFPVARVRHRYIIGGVSSGASRRPSELDRPIMLLHRRNPRRIYTWSRTNRPDEKCGDGCDILPGLILRLVIPPG